MYELIQAAERSYYIQSPAKIGLVQLVCLIGICREPLCSEAVLEKQP